GESVRADATARFVFGFAFRASVLAALELAPLRATIAIPATTRPAARPTQFTPKMVCVRCDANAKKTARRPRAAVSELARVALTSPRHREHVKQAQRSFAALLGRSRRAPRSAATCV